MKTIRSYCDPQQARIAQAMLESEGIISYLKNENFVSINPLLHGGMGGIELQVREEDAEIALELIGPDEGDRETVARISRRLDRIFGLTALAGIISGLVHAAGHGFSGDEMTESLRVGLIAAVIAFLLASMVTRR